MPVAAIGGRGSASTWDDWNQAAQLAAKLAVRTCKVSPSVSSLLATLELALVLSAPEGPLPLMVYSAGGASSDYWTYFVLRGKGLSAVV